MVVYSVVITEAIFSGGGILSGPKQRCGMLEPFPSLYVGFFFFHTQRSLCFPKEKEATVPILAPGPIGLSSLSLLGGPTQRKRALWLKAFLCWVRSSHLFRAKLGFSQMHHEKIVGTRIHVGIYLLLPISLRYCLFFSVNRWRRNHRRSN